MCLKLSCPVDCTTWLTRAGLISIHPARWKIHYRTAITYRPAQHKHWVSHAVQLELQPQRAHSMIVVSLIIKTYGSSKNGGLLSLVWKKKDCFLDFPLHSTLHQLIIYQPRNDKTRACSSCVACTVCLILLFKLQVIFSGRGNRCASL